MKKQTNSSITGRKLSLNKKTISNLQSSEMNQVIGGSREYCTLSCHGCNNTYKNYCGGATKNGKTCPGHNTCQYTCI